MSWRIHPKVAWVYDDTECKVYALQMPDNKPLVLDGGAVGVWFTLVHGDDPLTAVGMIYGADPAGMEPQIREVLAQLVDAGLVEQIDPAE